MWMPLVLAMALATPVGSDPVVRLQTELGAIDIQVFAGQAPRSAANFLRYVDAGRYENGVFHRTVRLDNQPANKVKIEVVQASVSPAWQEKDWPPIAMESTRDTGLRHLDGVVSMARDTPDTATSDFFVCIGDQPELDFGGRRNPDGQGFAAFGRVVRGMDVVRKIQAAAADGQKLTPPVVIRGAKRID
jgi:peptidyl-prolyl cis-trans isomerase A (cyclophilin A)